MLSDQLTLANNTANLLSTILTYTVPRGQVMSADLTRPLRILLWTHEEITPAGYATHLAQATAYVPCRVYKINDVAYADGVMQAVYLKSSGLARTITAVADHVDSTSAGTITCSDETNVPHMYCYVPWASGEILIELVAPGAGGEISRILWEGDIRTLHEINMRRDGMPLSFGCVLPENFKIRVRMKSAWVAYWTSGTTLLPVDTGDVEIPLLLSPMAAHARKGDKYPCQGIIQQALEYIGGH
jgi:hypothetical protein